MNEQTNERGLGIATIEKRGEMAVSAMAAKSKALVEAKFVMAMHRPRNLMQARAKILEACQRPHFARAALYAKPVAGQKMIGPSIRFAETAIQCMTNIDVSTTTIFEDDEKRTINIAVTDLESNLSYGKDITISKTVERRKLKEGQQAISERLNTYGERVYVVAATDDEIQNKIAAQESKVIRNCGLRLIPQDIIEEATEIINETRSKGAAGQDPAKETKKIADAFQALNISPVELEKYLGHSLSTISPVELEDLRDIYTTVKDGEASWASYLKAGPDKADPAKMPSFGKAVPIDPDDAPPGAEMPPVKAKPSKPQESPQPAKQTPQQECATILETVSFEDARSFLKHCYPDLDTDAIASWEMVPTDVCEKLLADPKLLAKFQKTYGKAKS